MADDNREMHRLRYRAAGDSLTVRDGDEVDGDEDTMQIRLPIASTGEVRNEGDDPLSRGELNGMARQLKEREIGVFPAHGDDDKIAFGRYSPFEKLGVWTDAAIDSREDQNLLMATAEMPDPETLPAATGDYREALAILKEQAKRGIPQDASIGWRDDEDFSGGVDLMEASIVGIGADPRTTTGDEKAEVVARAAIEAGADAEELVASVERAVESERPLGPPEDPDRFDSFEECKQAMLDEGYDEETAEAICGKWEQQAANSQESASTESMTEQDDPGDEDTGTDTQEQDADDGETRAPDDLTEDDLLTFTAMHLDGMDEGDLAEAVDAADATYIGECDAEALFDLVSTVTGAEYGTVEDAMADLMENGDTDEENEGDGYDDKEDDDDEDEDDDRDAVAELHERLDEIEDEIADVRSGETEVETPGDNSDEESDKREAEGTEEPETDDDRATDNPNSGMGGIDNLGDYT
jgi:hypothetical protein